jgi:hypothetical protein
MIVACPFVTPTNRARISTPLLLLNARYSCAPAKPGIKTTQPTDKTNFVKRIQSKVGKRDY